MTPYEIMLSESQERMLLVAERGREQRSDGRVCEMGAWTRWKLGASPAMDCMRITTHGKVAAEIPAKALADEAPVYQRPIAAPKTAARHGSHWWNLPAEGADLTREFSAIARVARHRQPSAGFGSSTINRCEPIRLPDPGASDAAVLRVKSTARGLALSVGW